METILKLALANGGVRVFREILQCCEELLGLPEEESAGGQPSDCRYRAGEFVGQWTDRGATGKVRADELGRNGENQARLDGRIERAEEVGERQFQFWISKGCDGRLHAIPGKIDPFQEMGYLVAADAESNLKDFRLTHFWLMAA